MNPLVEGAQPKQTERADQGDGGASQHEQGDKQGGPAGKIGRLDHSITSPRIRNLASATVPTNPRSAMTSAASK